MPFLVIAVEGALRGATRARGGRGDPRRVAGHGVPPGHPAADRARRSLPGSVLCWARALGEFGATITFAGNLPGTTQTMPLAVYLALDDDPDAAVALSLVLLAACVVVLVVLRGRWVPGRVR